MFPRTDTRRTVYIAALAGWATLLVLSTVAIAQPNSDAYRDSATGPDVAPISEQLDVVRAPEPGRATAAESRLRTVFQRTVKRTDIVEAPRPGRGRM